MPDKSVPNRVSEPTATIKLSAGVLVLNEHDELLLGHVTGQTQWDIPKGCVDAGEGLLEAALRELREETSIIAAPEALRDLGEFEYLSRKRLHLFEMQIAKSTVDPARLNCTSCFTHRPSGKRLPELDAFMWQPIAQLGERCSQHMLAALLRVASIQQRLACKR